jgi:tripartite-type tricarboxylate transporter receptor subunit TctC
MAMRKQKLLCLTFWAISAAAMTAPVVQAQNYPVKPVRIIVPTAPGGGTDLIGRLLAQNLSSQLGQQFIVDNRGGAGTTIGTAAVAKSPADGYTLLLTHSSLAFNATYYNKLPYDTLKDFAPISLVAEQPFLFAVHPSLPVKTVAQLIALAKKNPGQIAYSSGGAGSGPFMGAELFKQQAQVNILHVPYKGAGPAFTDLMGGQVQMMIATLSLGMPHATSGRVRALGVTSAKRLGATPQLPTVAESGLPGFEFSAWYGVLAPAGTPAAIMTRLHQAVGKAMAAPETREKFEDGLMPLSSTSDEFATYLKQEIIKWGNVVKASGVKAN